MWAAWQIELWRCFRGTNNIFQRFHDKLFESVALLQIVWKFLLLKFIPQNCYSESERICVCFRIHEIILRDFKLTDIEFDLSFRR